MLKDGISLFHMCLHRMKLETFRVQRKIRLEINFLSARDLEYLTTHSPLRLPLIDS